MTDMKSAIKLLNYVKSSIAYENNMVEDNENNNKLTPNVNNKKPQEYPEVPEEAIVKPEDERPVKTSITPEETTGEPISNTDEIEGSSSTDMDGDGSPDWDKSI
jgi:hypothetical protein